MDENKDIVIEEYINVKEKASQLNCNLPEGLAFLPRNFNKVETKEDLIQEGTLSTTRKLIKSVGIPETPLEKVGEKYPYVVEHDFSWISPIIFLSCDFISKNPELIGGITKVLINYLKDMHQKTKFSFVVEDKSGNYKKLIYSGDLAGLKDIPKIIREINNG